MSVNLAALILADPWRRSVLGAVRALALPDWAVGAGFVRNAVWDHLHGFAAPTPPARVSSRAGLPKTAAGRNRPPDDVDVLFFDPADDTRDREAALERQLAAALPGVPWSVRNQARMHRRNGDRPYTDTEDAIRFWLETATCVAVRLEADGRLTVIAPFGLDDLMALRSGPTARGREGYDAYLARMRAKDWPARWPKVRVAGL
jgi:uncharacterized protein